MFVEVASHLENRITVWPTPPPERIERERERERDSLDFLAFAAVARLYPPGSRTPARRCGVCTCEYASDVVLNAGSGGSGEEKVGIFVSREAGGWSYGL